MRGARISQASLERLAAPLTAAEVAGMSERHLQDRIVAVAEMFGWWCYHPHDSRHSASGWPDLSLVRDRLVFLELKREAAACTPDQLEVHERLRLAGQEVHVMRPSDWPAVVHLLCGEVG